MRKVSIVATVEYLDGKVEYKTFSSTTLGPVQLKAAIRHQLGTNPEVVDVKCGNYTATNSYGAH